MDLISSDEIRKSQVEYLPKAGTAEEVENRLEQILEWVDDDAVEWKRLGRLPNMSLLADITDGETGIVENVTNITDAYILENYDGGTYRNSRDAAENILTRSESSILRIDGEKGGDISLTFADKAHGQPTDEFNMFVDPVNTGETKRDKPFLQGCRGIGGMVALSNAQNGYKFIASAPSEDPMNWTWTIIRKDDGFDYEYLTINGEFPTFHGEFHCGEGIGAKTVGTVVKLYSYDLTTSPRNVVTSTAFRRRFSRKMVDSIIPVTLVESRYNSTYKYTYESIHNEVERNQELFYEPVQTTADIQGVGEVKISAYVAKSSEEREAMEDMDEVDDASVTHLLSSNDERVLVSLNGQTHAHYTEGQVRARTDFEHVSDNILVVAEVLDNPGSIQEDIFNAARSDFSNMNIKSRVEDHIFGFLNSSHELVDIDDKLDEFIETVDSDNEPFQMEIEDSSISCTFDDVPSTTLTFDGDISHYIDSAEFYVANNNYSLEIEDNDEDSITVSLEPDVETYPSREDELTVIGHFNHISSVCEIVIRYTESWTNETDTGSSVTTTNGRTGGKTGTETNNTNQTLLQMHSVNNLHKVHERTLNTLEEYNVAPVAKQLISRYGEENILANLPEMIEEGRPRIKGVISEKDNGKDVRQSTNSYIGGLNEILVYFALVRECEANGYVVRHEPTFDEINGIKSGDFVKPDMDIVIHEQDSDDAPLYIFSLKTTLRERIGQSALWKTWLDISTNTCGDCDCCSNNLDHNLFEKNERDSIYYGYITLEKATAQLLDMFDFGYVPSEHVDSSMGQTALESLSDDVNNSWSRLK